jgi:hypothetical protein
MAVVTIFDGTTPQGVRYGDWVEVPESALYNIFGFGVGWQFSIDAETPMSISKVVQVGSGANPNQGAGMYTLQDIPVKYLRADYGSTAGGVVGRLMVVTV